MSLIRTVTSAAAIALWAGSALAQTPATPPNNSPPQAPAAAEVAAPAVRSAAAQAFKPLPTTASGNLQATLAASGQFTKFLAAAEKTGMGSFLTGARPLTLFVPTDVAFDALPAGQLDTMLAAVPATQLQAVVVYHIVATKVTPDQVNGKKGPVPTAGGKSVELDGSVTPMKVADAVILQANVPATNGVIYVIDKVLTPPA